MYILDSYVCTGDTLFDVFCFLYFIVWLCKMLSGLCILNVWFWNMANVCNVTKQSYSLYVPFNK